MRTLRLAALFIAAISPSIASAAEWRLVANGADGTSIYIDASSVDTVTATTSLWVKFDFTTKRMTDEDRVRKAKLAELAKAGIYPNGNSVSMMPGEDTTPDHDLQRWQVRCADRTFAVFKSVIYNVQGNVVRTLEGDGKFSNPLPDSVAEDIVGRACK